MYRALKFAGSRHLICRLRMKDARSSVLEETLLPALNRTIGAGRYKYLSRDGKIEFPNGSEIWIGGLGDREQADKILGHEYCTIYFNEISQLSYAAVTTAYSRLAMKVPGCRNLFLYDCNPGSPLHWAYTVFIRKLVFRSTEPGGACTPLAKPELYASMLLNPLDNRAHLHEDYISDILDALPEKQRARFRDGLWVKAEGAIYDRFGQDMVLSPETLPESFDRFAAGQDFGLNVTNVKIGIKDNCIYILEDYGSYNMTTKSFNEELLARGWFRWNREDIDFSVFCDPAGGERIQEITNGIKANNSVDAGIDYIVAKMERGQFFVSSACSGVLSEIWDYNRDDDGEINKVNDHYMDAMRYAIFSDVQLGIVAV
jgi:hypothetical protein